MQSRLFGFSLEIGEFASPEGEDSIRYNDCFVRMDLHKWSLMKNEIFIFGEKCNNGGSPLLKISNINWSRVVESIYHRHWAPSNNLIERVIKKNLLSCETTSLCIKLERFIRRATIRTSRSNLYSSNTEHPFIHRDGPLINRMPTHMG